jgi:integrase
VAGSSEVLSFSPIRRISMSVYFVKRRGWRYDFTLKRTRYTHAWFETKKEALRAEAKRKEEIKHPRPTMISQTDMAFLELVNRKLDHVRAYNSESHYRDFFYNARRWIKKWGKLKCSQISQEMVQAFIFERNLVSAYAANQDLRYLRSVFNLGKKSELIDVNPTRGIEFLPIEKKIKYIPSCLDIDNVIQIADPDIQDYLNVLRETIGRVGEINRLVWDDVNLEDRYVVLYTRKKKGGHLTPRKVPMSEKLYRVLSKRYARRDRDKPWVFWHTFKSRKTGEVISGPYKDRKIIMKNLCKKAGVKYFRFHALRHAGASVMDNNNVHIGAIQRILGHENRSTTEIYLHSFGIAEREAISIYEKVRQNSHTESHTGMDTINEKGLAESANPSYFLVSPVGIEPTTY